MAGAGSILAANHINNVAPKDGTVIGNISGQIILEQLFANPVVQYDMAKSRTLAVPIGETFYWWSRANLELQGSKRCSVRRVTRSQNVLAFLGSCPKYQRPPAVVTMLKRILVPLSAE